MKKLILPLLIAIPMSWANSPDIQSPNNKNSKIVLDALDDFSIISAGDAPYYKDKRNDALGIDARVDSYRDLFARATTTFNGSTGHYDVSITVVTEEDGEPLYRLLVNGDVTGVYRSDYIGQGSDRDLKPKRHTWRGIALNTGDTISIESAADTNGEIPENDGTAWARGRWQQVAFTPAKKKPSKKRAHFDKHTDLLLAQFDLKPDADDVHAIAALGSMLAHEDFDGVKYFAVSGTVGIQGGTFINANSLFTQAFGRENLYWTDANKHWDRAVTAVKNRARATLAQGGRVWVQEAGQSDFTAAWIKLLKDAGVHPSVLKNNITVVQHSAWNEEKTSPTALAYVKKTAHYQAIGDGNKTKRVFIRKNRRGPATPIYVEQDKKWIKAATSKRNNREHARALWKEADKIVQKSGFNAKHSVIPMGGVDFSDVVESWWIFNLDQPAVSVHAFWERYVTDVELDKIQPPKGRLAVVIDGNSPDPDDIGATPVMFGILQATGLSDRLVHISHSCDLDPFSNKARFQIDKANEKRRQDKLHELSGRSIELFGPFKNLREYYNCRVDQAGATQDLVDAINDSTAKNPLWIVEAGEPDLIGYALEAANKDAVKHVHVISHHPANDNSGDYWEWQQILDFGVTEYQIGDQNVPLQTPISDWDWTINTKNPGFAFIREMLAYAEQDGIVPFQGGHYDCSDAGMVYWWITGANEGGNNFATPADMKDMLQGKLK